jgi:hypothetical protein
MAYVGAIRSQAGFGARVRPFWNWEPLRKLEITADFYNFGRSAPVGKAQVNTGVQYPVTRWLYLGVRAEDIYYTSNINTYANVVVRDDDIAYILGLVGLARP